MAEINSISPGTKLNDGMESFCPACKKELDAFGSVNEDAKPDKGDYTVCFGCAEILRFGKDLVLYQPSVIELDALDLDMLDTISNMVQMVREFHGWLKTNDKE